MKLSLAGIAGKAAAAISLRPGLLGLAATGVVALMAFASYAGMRYERAGWQTRQIRGLEKSRETERSGVGIAHDAEARKLTADRNRQEKADEEIKRLEVELAKRPARCPVSRAAVRVLDGTGVPATSRAPARAEGAAEKVAADAATGEGVECGAVVQNCGWNRVNTCEPNAAHVLEIQAFYERLLARFNRR